MELNKENVDYIQSACNPVAVANQLNEWSKDVLHERNNMNDVIDNVLLKAVIGKLCSLYGIDHNGDQAYAYLTGGK